MKKPNLRVKFFKDAGGCWRWHVKAKNGRIVCTSGESFASKSNARRAWKAFRRGMAEVVSWHAA